MLCMVYFLLLFFSLAILSINSFPDYLVPLSKGQHKHLLLYASYRLFHPSYTSWYMSSRCHTCILYKILIVGWDGFNVFNRVVEMC